MPSTWHHDSGIAALRVTASDHAARIDQLIREISRTPRHDPACERMLDQSVRPAPPIGGQRAGVRRVRASHCL